MFYRPSKDRVGVVLFDQTGERVLLVTEESQKRGFPKGRFFERESLRKAAFRHLTKDTGIDLASTQHRERGSLVLKFGDNRMVLFQFQLQEEPFLKAHSSCRSMEWIPHQDLLDLEQFDEYNSPVRIYVKLALRRL